MKKLSIIAASILVILMTSSCSKDDDFIGSGIPISELRNVSAFNKISSEGVFTINIIQGTTQSLEIIADNNIIDKVKTVVTNNELRLYLSDGNYNNINLEANIVVPNLNRLKNFGVGNVTINDLNIEGDFTIENEGSGDIIVSGSAHTFKINNEGSGAIDGSQFLCSNSEIRIFGSGDCEVYCTELLDVTIEGSGKVYYQGNPVINTTISGSGNVVNVN